VHELHRAVGDHFLGGVDVEPRPREGWRSAVRRLCLELRRVQLRQPRLAAFVRSAPTRLGNELAFTEALLRELRRGGFTAATSARAYHALIELTVGSAAIDAPLAAEDDPSRAAVYRQWRDDYASLAAEQHPSIAVVAPHLYTGTADDRFEEALDLLLDGLAARRRRPH
jgi:TetR/AcrR family transcriptional regulator, tetracycline repressor protein